MRLHGAARQVAESGKRDTRPRPTAQGTPWSPGVRSPMAAGALSPVSAHPTIRAAADAEVAVSASLSSHLSADTVVVVSALLLTAQPSRIPPFDRSLRGSDLPLQRLTVRQIVRQIVTQHCRACRRRRSCCCSASRRCRSVLMPPSRLISPHHLASPRLASPRLAYLTSSPAAQEEKAMLKDLRAEKRAREQASHGATIASPLIFPLDDASVASHLVP
jgi:hypothetical protein